MTMPTVRVRVTVPSILLHPDHPYVFALGCGHDRVDRLTEALREAEWETGHKIGERPC
jgi:hypothetical protein